MDPVKYDSFEQGSYQWRGIQEINVPLGYKFGFAGPDVFNEWDPAHRKFTRPECHVLNRFKDFPVHEQGDLYIFPDGGDHCWKAFGRSSTWFWIWKKVYLEPGEHQFTAHINADLVDHYENGQKVPAPDPQSGQFRFGADSDKTEWRTLQPYLKMNAHTWTFTIDEARDVNIGIEIRLPHALKSNGVFIDALELVRLVPEPPQRQFDQEIHLYAQNLSPKKLSQVLAYAKPKEQSMTPSVDSAFFWGPALKTKTVHVWDAVSVAGGRQALRAWVETYHKPWPKVIWH